MLENVEATRKETQDEIDVLEFIITNQQHLNLEIVGYSEQTSNVKHHGSNSKKLPPN